MSRPLEHVVFGSTGIAPDLETDLRDKVKAMGGEMRHSVTVGLLFLIVGKRWSAKYNFALSHGATLLSADALFDVYLRWKSGEDLNVVEELKKQKLAPFHGMRLCLSNLDVNEKQGFASIIESGGGVHTGALSMTSSILISPEKRGKKVEGAYKWKIPVVAPRWVTDSMRVGAAIDPKHYDLNLPESEMGPQEILARSSTNTPTEEHGMAAPVLKRRKSDLLFNASFAKRGRLSSAQLVSLRTPSLTSTAVSAPTAPKSVDGQNISGKLGLFHGLKFHFHGFDTRQLSILKRTVESHHGSVDSVKPHYVIVRSSSPRVPPGFDTKTEGVAIVTEWALERTLHLKQLALSDKWGMPVYSQPGRGFAGLRISISGFTDIEQRHTIELIKLLGATFAETLTADRDILIASSSSSRKVPYAVNWNIPVVSIDWLWQSALAGEALLLDGQFVLDGKGTRPPPIVKSHSVLSGHHGSGGGSESSIGSRANIEDREGGTNGASRLEKGQPSDPPDADDLTRVRYHDYEDAQARAELLKTLGEEPADLPHPEPPVKPAETTRARRRRI